MRIVMVKKRLQNGEPCRKCVQAEQLLRARGLWHRLDQVLWADEGNEASAGMVLAREFDVSAAPFFLVYPEGESGAPLVYTSALRLMREHMPNPSGVYVKPIEDGEVAAWQDQFRKAHPREVLRWALARYGQRCALAFSGAEDVVLIDLAVASGQDFSVFCLDTGRLHSETYRYIEKVRSHYGIEIDMRYPEAEPLQLFVRHKGLYSFYDDGHKECCGIRKVAPLRKTLANYDAWATGQRRDQSPATRAEVPVVQIDGAFEGAHGTLLKFNPLANWSSAQTWAYIREHNVPYNPLHERGFISIGCEPCTRPTLPGQHEREGRWWWEESTLKECGLHSTSPEEPASQRAAVVESAAVGGE